MRWPSPELTLNEMPNVLKTLSLRLPMPGGMNLRSGSSELFKTLLFAEPVFSSVTLAQRLPPKPHPPRALPPASFQQLLSRGLSCQAFCHSLGSAAHMPSHFFSILSPLGACHPSDLSSSRTSLQSCNRYPSKPVHFTSLPFPEADLCELGSLNNSVLPSELSRQSPNGEHAMLIEGKPR